MNDSIAESCDDPPVARVLLAEDDPDLRVGLTLVLQRAGYDVCAVGDGARLLEQVAGFLLDDHHVPADVLVTDVRMPGVNGLSVVEGLRAGGWTHPTVVISAFGDAAMRERLGVLDHVIFLPKPFDPEKLQQALAHMLEREDRSGRDGHG